MQVIPVVDLLAGQVVHAVAGLRHQYQPLCSQLCSTPQPADVARALATSLTIQQVYVADLDAIQGKGIQWDSVAAVAHYLPEVWCDLGIRSEQQLDATLEIARQRQIAIHPILALETIVSRAELLSLARRSKRQGLMLSLDLRGGVPMTSCADWYHATPWEIACESIHAGFSQLLILDLAAVGTNAGLVTLPLCRQLHEEFPQLRIATGGGVRHGQDLLDMEQAGVSLALVGSALHDGRIGPREIGSV